MLEQIDSIQELVSYLSQDKSIGQFKIDKNGCYFNLDRIKILNCSLIELLSLIRDERLFIDLNH